MAKILLLKINLFNTDYVNLLKNFFKFILQIQFHYQVIYQQWQIVNAKVEPQIRNWLTYFFQDLTIRYLTLMTSLALDSVMYLQVTITLSS